MKPTKAEWIVFAVVFIGVLVLSLKMAGQEPPAPVVAPVPDQKASVTLAWDPSPDNAWVVDYKIHTGTNAGIYSRVESFGTNLTATVTNLTIGETYYFASTAVGTNQLESEFSNEIEFTVPAPPKPPENLRVEDLMLIRITVEGTDDFADYTNVIEFLVLNKQGSGYFRSKVGTELVPAVEW